MRRLTILSLLILYAYTCHSQQFGGNPTKQKWQQINTDTARIIFPAGLDSQANRIANVVHYIAANKPATLGDKLKKINIVLQHNTTVPNAYVGLGPFRSEFFMTPATMNFDQGSIEWTDQLALHEYRHVEQFNNFNNGLSKAMGVLFGEDGYALAINAAVPDWFFEGDAVFQETELSEQGRGRIPFFLNAYPSLWLADKKYSWMKLRNGSLKDYVPNHYYLGYLLVNYGYMRYGNDFWKKVTTDASAYKGLFYPFQAAIKRHTGAEYKAFRDSAFAYYKNLFPGKEVTPVKKNYVTSYLYPFRAGEDSLIYLKTSYRHRPAFYLEDASGQHKIKVRDITLDNQFSYRNGKIVYSSYETHPRWGWKDYSVIKVLDVSTKKQYKLTNKSKYFMPDISESGNRIAAVQNDSAGRSELHIIDASTGQIIKAIHSVDISVFTDPKFIGDQNIVTAVRLIDGRMALALAEVETGNTTRLTPPSYNVVGNPFPHNGYIYFTASYNGNDDVYALRRSDNKIFRITHGPLGNYFVSAGGGKISWSTLTAEGYEIEEAGEDVSTWEPVAIASMEPLQVIFPISTAPGAGDILMDAVPSKKYSVSNYRKGKGLINLHSWRPNYDDPTFSFSIYGENVLNTLQTELYYLYHTDEKTHAIGFSTTYGAWFPFINLGAEYTFNRESTLNSKPHIWDQLDSRIGFVIPISKASGQTFKDFSFSTFFVVRNEFNKDYYKDSLGTTTFAYLTHNINWTQQVQRAVQHIYPRWAWSVNASYRYAVTRYEGYQAFALGRIYVPGFLSNHNLILSGSFQQRDTNFVLFSSRFANARGYVDYYGTNAGSRLTRLSADYHFPLWHTDWGFANIVYLQRLRANLFYDYQKIYSDDKTRTIDLRSTGVEFYADTKWWNQYPLTFGFRISRLLDDDLLARTASGSWIYEFILPVSIIPR